MANVYVRATEEDRADSMERAPTSATLSCSTFHVHLLSQRPNIHQSP